MPFQFVKCGFIILLYKTLTCEYTDIFILMMHQPPPFHARKKSFHQAAIRLAAALFLGAVALRAESGDQSPKLAEENGWRLLELRRIWDKAPHNAFTDLIRYKGHWYCAFREAGGHHERDGRLRVIRSPDGVEWETVALMQGENAGDDVRDSRFSIMPDGGLMINGFISLAGGKEGARRAVSVTWLSPDGIHWSRPYACPTGSGTWRWSATWHGGYAYSIGYSGKDRNGCLYRTKDGKNWEVVLDDFFPGEFGAFRNEASLHFDEDGTAYCLLRRDKPHDWSADAPDSSALLGVSKPPYTGWQWKDLGVRMGGPILRRLKDGRFVTAVRLYSPPRMALLEIDPATAAVTKLLDLPSGGDCAYAGLVEDDGVLWISYYSSHEGKTAVYLAKVGIPPRTP